MENRHCGVRLSETSRPAGVACFPKSRNPTGESPCSRARLMARLAQTHGLPVGTIPENLLRVGAKWRFSAQQDSTWQNELNPQPPNDQPPFFAAQLYSRCAVSIFKL